MGVFGRKGRASVQDGVESRRDKLNGNIIGKTLLGVRVDKIITLADKSAELQIRVFVRSLRNVGCELPVWVIPFWERDFELPSTCRWIEDSKVLRFLRQNAAAPALQQVFRSFAKQLRLLRHRYHFAFENRANGLRPRHRTPLRVADTEWAKNRPTSYPESRRFLVTLSPRWPLFTFNSGFFAFEEPLYEVPELMTDIQSPELKEEPSDRKVSPVDQPAINWLVLRKQRNIFNFNLPPQSMESTMAVDYDESSGLAAVVSGISAPAFLHYAGPLFEQGHFLTQLFTSYLTVAERREWDANIKRKRDALRWLERWPWPIRALNRFVRLIDPRFHVQPKFPQPTLAGKCGTSPHSLEL